MYVTEPDFRPIKVLKIACGTYINFISYNVPVCTYKSSRQCSLELFWGLFDTWRFLKPGYLAVYYEF